MSFFGGNNSLATSTPAKPGGLFAASFGTAAGGQAATPGWGATPATAAAPAFGATAGFGGTGAFGVAGSTPAPSLGGFGGFGTSTTVTSTAPALGGGFGGFGATNTTTSTSSGSMFAAPATGFGGFGTAGAGTGAAAAPVFGGFGTQATAAGNAGQPAFGGFGTTATTSTAPAFGGFGTQQTAFGGNVAAGGGAFGQGAFGSNFGRMPTTTVTPGFGGFGGKTNFMLGQPQQQMPQLSPDEAFAQSIFNVSIYGDERDAIIAKWNYLQAMWGTGKSFYSQTAAAVEITPQNYLMRLKAIGYSRLPGRDNKMGLVALNFNKALAEVKTQQPQIMTALNAVMGNKPTLQILVEALKEHEEKKTQMVIYVEERSQMTPTEIKRILSTDLATYLNQANVRPQLNNFGVIEVLALVLPDEDQLQQYLEIPPKGIDPRMWRQAKLDNPDATKLIPVPMISFNDLKWRIKCQENETETHGLYLKKLERDLSELRQRHACATAKIMEHKRGLAELSHRVLKIIVKQECTRKMGMSLSPEEEALRTKLENMQAIVSAPTQFKGRLSELLSQMRMQRSQYSLGGVSEYTIDKDAESEMQSFLAMQQKAMEVLMDTVKKDTQALQIIRDGMPELMRG